MGGVVHEPVTDCKILVVIKGTVVVQRRTGEVGVLDRSTVDLPNRLTLRSCVNRAILTICTVPSFGIGV
jgi:hypothetical protein